ncbi:dihydroorotate dehydrogenase-like protein [Rhodohalobacter mucosus]|uniref:Dihydroorotate dehydrogenase-like protein n=1 Tax=Rhodohalobacter mucosus TaxID=2079485 RepID=A0A316TS60_9BACT|nr:dihydroorotate dehydrogenase-like protein [Rhodohalobacter mucosus]PWN06698.1 dihydroorotate dehydrogenase-like protein [Rhodohalobacter mucosus]
MINLETEYLGLKLKNPLVPSASPLSESVDAVRKMEDYGASAVVMYSLFEEQITHENKALDHYLSTTGESYAEALSYFPEPEEYKNIQAEEYLEQIRLLKEAVDIPVIASLNGVSKGGWMSYASKMQEAGADAIELNIYYVATDPSRDASEIETMYLDNIKQVKEAVSIPVSVKTGPYFSSFANMAMKMEKAGADGLVLFNRFYQPDIDLENLEILPSLQLSHSFEKRLPLRWIAILRPLLKSSLAATTGIHSAEDVIKMILAGADVAMMASLLLVRGVKELTLIENRMKEWMEEHQYASLDQMKGSMDSRSVAEPAAFERANYLKILQSY